MTSRFKVPAVCLGALRALVMLGATAAQAARPFQPQWTANGATLKSNISIEFHSGVSRLWAPGLSNVVIVCKKDEGTALLKPEGKDEVDKLLFKECSLAEVKENATTKKLEEGPEIKGCIVKNEGGTEGTIEVPTPLQSKLVWTKGGTPRVLNLFKPNTGTVFVKLAFEKKGAEACLLATKFEVEGEQLGIVPRFSAANAYDETEAGLQTFETNNKNKEVRALFNEWEVGAETGKAELTIKKGESKIATALESYEQVERQSEGTGAALRRGLFGATE